jgi:hypothetical protein
MDFVGFVNLENTLYAPLLTINVLGQPADSDAAPTIKIYEYDFSSVLVSGTTASSVSSATGVYLISQNITSALGFAAGNNYTVITNWDVAASARQAAQVFHVS